MLQAQGTTKNRSRSKNARMTENIISFLRWQPKACLYADGLSPRSMRSQTNYSLKCCTVFVMC